MSPDACRLVHDSWARAAPAADRLSHDFYTRLFEIDPDAGRLFAATDMDAQRRKFGDMLAAIVRAIDEPDSLVAASAALGRRHASYGVDAQHYDRVGEALDWALGRTLGDDFTPDVRAGWREAYALLASVMRRAAGCASGAHPTPAH